RRPDVARAGPDRQARRIDPERRAFLREIREERPDAGGRVCRIRLRDDARDSVRGRETRPALVDLPLIQFSPHTVDEHDRGPAFGGVAAGGVCHVERQRGRAVFSVARAADDADVLRRGNGPDDAVGRDVVGGWRRLGGGRRGKSCGGRRGEDGENSESGHANLPRRFPTGPPGDCFEPPDYFAGPSICSIARSADRRTSGLFFTRSRRTGSAGEAALPISPRAAAPARTTG